MPRNDSGCLYHVDPCIWTPVWQSSDIQNPFHPHSKNSSCTHQITSLKCCCYFRPLMSSLELSASLPAQRVMYNSFTSVRKKVSLLASVQEVGQESSKANSLVSVVFKRNINVHIRRSCSCRLAICTGPFIPLCHPMLRKKRLPRVSVQMGVGGEQNPI